MTDQQQAEAFSDFFEQVDDPSICPALVTTEFVDTFGDYGHPEWMRFTPIPAVEGRFRIRAEGAGAAAYLLGWIYCADAIASDIATLLRGGK